jgi:hypothetical protein
VHHVRAVAEELKVELDVGEQLDRAVGRVAQAVKRVGAAGLDEPAQRTRDRQA